MLVSLLQASPTLVANTLTTHSQTKVGTVAALHQRNLCCSAQSLHQRKLCCSPAQFIITLHLSGNTAFSHIAEPSTLHSAVSSSWLSPRSHHVCDCHPSVSPCACSSSAVDRRQHRHWHQPQPQAGKTVRITRQLATQAADAQHASRAVSAEEEHPATQRRLTRGLGRAAATLPNSAMHTPSDTPTSSTAVETNSAARMGLRSSGSAHAVGVRHIESGTASRKAAATLGTTPTGKPPLPPTVSKAVSAYRSAHKGQQAAASSKAPSLRTRGSSPALASASLPSFGKAASTSQEGSARPQQGSTHPATRSLMQQQHQQQLSGKLSKAAPNAAGEHADVVSLPTVHGRSKQGAAVAAADDPSGSTGGQPASSSHARETSKTGRQAAAAGKLLSRSRKRVAEVPLCQLASEGELLHLLLPDCCWLSNDQASWR